MERIDKILNHELFRLHTEQNCRAEEKRQFCHHDMTHFLDVARIGMLINLEEKMGLDREMIYAAALLHDLGRHIQYENGTPHELASAEIAGNILKDCKFEEKEAGVIIEAVKSHRDNSVALQRNLCGVLYRADKASRACFACGMQEKCDWKKEKKNLTIRY